VSGGHKTVVDERPLGPAADPDGELLKIELGAPTCRSLADHIDPASTM